MKVALYTSCVVDLMFPRVGVAATEVLERLGCEVYSPQDQICCGQITYNNGYVKASDKVIHNQIDAFIDADIVVGLAGSCTAMFKEYHKMLRPDDTEYQRKAAELSAKTYEFSQFLWRVLKVHDVGATLNARATYHRSCHMSRLLPEIETPFWLLDHVAGLEMIPIPHVENCCGFGGTFSMKEPFISDMMVTEKMQDIMATDAEILISCDMACLMNIAGKFNRAGNPIKIMHLAEVLNTGVDMQRMDQPDPVIMGSEVRY